MKLVLTINQIDYQADLSQAQSIAINLIPNGEQPSHFGAPACKSETLEGGGFIGDTKRGGSCNVNQLTLVPHCNGTHTESVAHIVDELLPVFSAIKTSLFACVLISIEPQFASEVNEQYVPGFDAENQVISRKQLEEKLSIYKDEQLTGLVIRTLPNVLTKKKTTYGDDNYPVYLTNDAMRYIVERKVEHLLVDFPSVDKMYDEGKLSNHRIFWNVELASTQLNENSEPQKTISELVFVEDAISDGFYLCNLQVPQIETDAVPSRPELIPLVKA